jgi:hypothetical protein
LAVHPSGELLVGGTFMTAGGAPSSAFARWSDTGVPWIAVRPAPRVVPAGDDGIFSITPAAGYTDLAYAWRKDGQPLNDGVTSHGSVVSGSSAPVLTIASARAADAGVYDCVVSSPCGPAQSSAAALTVTGACPADWNADGVANSADISAFLTAWLGSVMGGTLVADFNADSQVNSNDISAFLTAWLDAVQTGC